MIIKDIKEVYDFKFEGEDYWSYQGYIITLDNFKFHILIKDSIGCCEDFGQICSNDNFEDFIGAEVIEFSAKDDADYNDIPLFKKIVANASSVDVFDCAFINFETNKGTLQFAVYNHHNGYYGHDIKLYAPEKYQLSALYGILNER